MNHQTNRILIASDGSPQSLNAAHFVSRTMSPNSSHITLFQVLSAIPEQFYDFANDLLWKEKIKGLRTWEQQQRNLAENAMARISDLFQHAGFIGEAVEKNISDAEKGIARDIIRRARRGYQALVIGRGRERSSRSALLGSVASKILETTTADSVWLVGENASSKKILIAVDSSSHAGRIMDRVCRLFNHRDKHFLIFHAIRGASTMKAEIYENFSPDYQQQLLTNAEETIRPIIQHLENKMRQMMIAPDRISSKITSNVDSRAAAIADETRLGGYGTIVVGKRGISSISDFSMGRVTKKLTHLAAETGALHHRIVTLKVIRTNSHIPLFLIMNFAKKLTVRDQARPTLSATRYHKNRNSFERQIRVFSQA